jgi:chitinase
MTPAQIDFSIVDQALYYFVVPDDDGNLQLLNDTLAKQLVSAAHENGKYAGFTIGGPQGSDAFAELTTNASKRLAFAETIINTVTNYNFDAVEVRLLPVTIANEAQRSVRSTGSIPRLMKTPKVSSNYFNKSPHWSRRSDSV